MSNDSYCLILPAAGSGNRMNSEIPKPLLQLAGKSVLYWAIKVFASIPELKQIIIPTQASMFEQISSILDHVLSDAKRNDIKVDIIVGGKERLFSIANALPYISKEVNLIMVHDAVRPLVSIKSILNCIETAKKSNACVLGLPLRETIKQTDGNGQVLSTPDRKSLWSIQTPQCFSKSVFVEAYKNALHHKYFGTDDSSVIEFAGFPVLVSEGNSENIKITYPLDLKLAEILMINRDN